MWFFLGGYRFCCCSLLDTHTPSFSCSLGLEHLYGTNLLRAYMHGFFIDIRLYEKAKAISNPFEYEEYQKKMLQEKIDKSRGSRISIQKKKLPSVNKLVAQKLLTEKGGDADGENPLGDDRFGAMFKDPKYEVDEESEEFKLMYPQKVGHLYAFFLLFFACCLVTFFSCISQRMKALEESFRKIEEDPYSGEREGKDSDESSGDSDDGTELICFLSLFDDISAGLLLMFCCVVCLFP